MIENCDVELNFGEGVDSEGIEEDDDFVSNGFSLIVLIEDNELCKCFVIFE